MTGDRVADRVAGALLPLALAAVALAVLLPSEEIATRADLLLAVLVVLTALGIAPHELSDLRTRVTAMAALSRAPFLVLVPLAWVLSRLFNSPVREGVLTFGLSSTEVAVVGLVALAGGDAALTLGALAGSLIAVATPRPTAHRAARRRRRAHRHQRTAGPLRARRPAPAGRRYRRARRVSAHSQRRALVRGRLHARRGRTHLRRAQRHLRRRSPSHLSR
jgi:hypothetical protein